jgi:hypothetical protein
MVNNKAIFSDQQKLAIEHLKAHKAEAARLLKDKEGISHFPVPSSIFEKIEKLGYGTFKEALLKEIKCIQQLTSL